MNSSKRRIFAGAIALALVAAACGSDDDSSDTTEAPAGTDAATATDAPAATDAATDATDAPAATDAADSTDAAPSGEPVSGTLIGAGSSAQQAAMAGWQAGFQTLNPDATVEYDPVGSGGGRETFLAGGSDFAGSDAPLKDEEYTTSVDRCAGDQGAINLPHYISPIAVAYNLPGVDDLNLSPDVLAGIFTGAITTWDDPAIAADNPDAALPSTTVNPVHRSDDSGTTQNFTDYLSATAPDVWTYGAIQAWDTDGPGGGEGAPQTSGVIAAIGAGEGSVGYADASQAADLSSANIKVGEEWVPVSAEAAAKLVDVSERVPGRSEFDFSYKLARDTTEVGVYPLTLVSYHIVCLQYDDQAKVDLVKAFMTYVGSEEGQADAADAAGSAPITADTQSQLEEAINQISVGS